MKFGIIGGSGLYDIEGLENVETMGVETPFGHSSAAYRIGKLEGKEVIFLPRHGEGHTLLPSELNHKANIYGMKRLGVTHILSISAVGSLREELKPRDIVLVDQYVDRTKNGLGQTFFGNGLVAHIAFGEPVCPELHALVRETADELTKGMEVNVHPEGTYINMEGPAFSTKAESKLYKSWGMDVIGMTNMAEAKLAREAEICYCTVAMVTDYDCWHPDHDHVSVDMIIQNLQANAKLAKQLVKSIAMRIDELKQDCPCPTALSTAIISNPKMVPEQTKKDLAPIIGKYMR